MTTSERSHQYFKDAGWTCIHLDGLQVMRARLDDRYHEFFKTAHICRRYAIFSVANGYDYFFQNEQDAVLFLLRWT